MYVENGVWHWCWTQLVFVFLLAGNCNLWTLSIPKKCLKVCNFYRKSRLLEKSQDFFQKSLLMKKSIFFTTYKVLTSKKCVLFTKSPDFWRKVETFFQKSPLMLKSVFFFCEKYWLLKSLHFLHKVQTLGEKSRLFFKSHYLWKSFLKSPVFNSQRLALHQNGVEFCQQFIGAIRNSLTVS